MFICSSLVFLSVHVFNDAISRTPRSESEFGIGSPIIVVTLPAAVGVALPSLRTKRMGSA
jgi:hypothetical protein